MRRPAKAQAATEAAKNAGIQKPSMELLTKAQEGDQKAKLDYNRQAVAYNTWLEANGHNSGKLIIIDNELTKEEVINILLGGKEEETFLADDGKDTVYLTGNFEDIENCEYETYERFERDFAPIKFHKFSSEGASFYFQEVIGGW